MGQEDPSPPARCGGEAGGRVHGRSQARLPERRDGPGWALPWVCRGAFDHEQCFQFCSAPAPCPGARVDPVGPPDQHRDHGCRQAADGGTQPLQDPGLPSGGEKRALRREQPRRDWRKGTVPVSGGRAQSAQEGEGPALLRVLSLSSTWSQVLSNLPPPHIWTGTHSPQTVTQEDPGDRAVGGHLPRDTHHSSCDSLAVLPKYILHGRLGRAQPAAPACPGQEEDTWPPSPAPGLPLLQGFTVGMMRGCFLLSRLSGRPAPSGASPQSLAPAGSCCPRGGLEPGLESMCVCQQMCVSSCVNVSVGASVQ
ncbi:hypothetical protein H1C71_035005 [Ictidomys tridecemlineatus]|nr:hypothetical protein H1C71_035005 [Ictidomys tridecemlineatus]